MNLEGSTALVTGANRGIGRHFAQQLLERGAAKVYATARDPRDDRPPRRRGRCALDITDPARSPPRPSRAADVTLLINNAGVSTAPNLVTGDLDQIRLELDTHFYGTLAMVRAFAPILAPTAAARSSTSSRALSWMSYAGRERLRRREGGGVEPDQRHPARARRRRARSSPALLLGGTDTDMMAGWDIPKNDPADVVRAALDGIEAGALEVIADADTATPRPRSAPTRATSIC